MTVEQHDYTSIETAGWSHFTKVRYGSNKQLVSVPEHQLVAGSNSVAAQRLWDTLPADGIDSGWVSVSFTLPSNGNVVSNVVGSTGQLSLSAGTVSRIYAVDVLAVVQNQASFAWQQLTVKFYNGSTLLESQTVNAPSVDTTADGPSTAEQVLRFTPASTSANKVVVTGQVRITCPAGVYLGEDDSFGIIGAFVNGAPAQLP